MASICANICKDFGVGTLVLTKTIEYPVGIGLDAGRGRFKPSVWLNRVR